MLACPICLNNDLKDWVQIMMIKGVIFDMDGLMIDTEKLLKRFWCQAANEFGYPMKEKHVLSIRSLAAKYAIPKLKGYFGEDFDYDAVRSRRMELMNRYIEQYGVEKKKGLDELIAYLKKENIKMAVATATDEIRTKKYLESIGIYHLFDEIVCATMVENGKPAPDIYRKAAEVLQIPPENCMALEDSPNGIMAAFSAGCIPVMVPDLDEPKQETLDILYKKVEDLEKVISVIAELNRGKENKKCYGRLYLFRKKFVSHTEWSMEAGEEKGSKCERFIPEFYLAEVEEPEFGCEGRPEGTVVYAGVEVQFEDGFKVIPIEERKLWNSGWDDGMWIGIMEEKREKIPAVYQEKTRKWKVLSELEIELYQTIKEKILEEEKD